MATVHGELLAGRWRLGDQIGRGAFADVYEGVDDTTGERVAVKVLRRTERAQHARFEREVSALESLDHPGIVAVEGHGELDGHPFVVMECIDGGTLADELVARGALAPERACALGAELADALDHAHQRGVVHRDVKPSNVLLDEHGRSRLADFGVAQLDGSSSLTASGFTVGTAAYLAPEQVRGETVGPPADVYALGLLLLESVTGERTYPGAGVAAAMARLSRPPEIPPSVPAPLAERLREMTAMAPGDRPMAATVAADLADLAELPAGDGTAVIPVVDDATEEIAVVPVPTAVPAVADEPFVDAGDAAVVVPPVDRGWRRLAFAALCFVAGFLLVLGVRALADSGDGDLVPPTTVAPSTTAVPPSTTAAPPTTAPPPDEDREEREQRGNGRGRGNDDD